MDTTTSYKRDDSLDLSNPQTRSLLLVAAAVAFGVWHVLTNVYWIEPGRWQNAIHFAGFAFFASVMFSPFGARANTRLAWTIDLAYGLLIAAAALWVAGAENALYDRSLAVTSQGWQLTIFDWSAGFILVFACIDLSRRVSGWVIPILVVLALSYILFLGSYMPGVFRAASLPLNDVMFRTLYNDEGLFGILASISSTNITLFMIFGGFLVVSGASNFVIELSKIVAGRVKGGAAFVAVHHFGLGGCQHRLNRGHHHPADEGQRLSPAVRGCCRGRRIDRWPTHAAHHGRRRICHGQLYCHSLWHHCHGVDRPGLAVFPVGCFHRAHRSRQTRRRC